MSKNEISDLLDQLFRQAQMQFGSAIKSRWFHQGEGCPGCRRKIDAMKFKGKCAKQIHDTATPIPLHTEIEKNLKQEFLKRSGH